MFWFLVMSMTVGYAAWSPWRLEPKLRHDTPLDEISLYGQVDGMQFFDMT